jgi:diguanylate cyclase (GGDEF)-like protein
LPHIPPHTDLDPASTGDLASRESDRSRIQVALEQTLSIATAETDSQLLARTLAAACEITGALVAVAMEPDGSLRVHGDPTLAAKLDHAPRPAWPDALTEALAAAGLPSALTVRFGDTLIAVADRRPARLGPDTGSLLALLVAHALAARARLREIDRLSRQAESDPLTGLRHSRPFVRRLNASSPGRTAVIAVDVDDFKRINDEYGHQAGDHALLTLVDALRSALRGDDQLYRIGGDEFAVIVDVNGPGEVVAISRRLLDAARQIGQTVSVGAALHMLGETGRETLRRADKALYQAKRAGRDTARLAPTHAHAA